MTHARHASLGMTAIGRVVSKLQALSAQLPAAERAVVDDLLRAAGVVETAPLQYNPYLPGVHTDPYPHYHRLHAGNPVHWSEAMQAWVVSRYADVVAAFREPRLSYRTGFDTMMACVPAEEHDGVRAVTHLIGSLLNEIDPPNHTRLRRIMARALAATDTPRRAPHIASIANRLLDAVQPAGRMDIVADFAYPLPVRVGADLLGVPTPDRDRFGAWIDSIVHTFSEGFSGTGAMRRGEAATVELAVYMERLLEQRRASSGHDVLSAMLADGDATDGERVLIAINIVMGMHENVTHAISLSMNTVLRDRALVAYLRQAPPESLRLAVEEMLRHEGTAPILSRVALDNIEIGGVTIPKGQRVILLLAAANRDVARFDSPDEFIPDRQPNPHIAFGIGRRTCPGSGLARSIIQAAVTALLTRFPDMRLVEAEPAWRDEVNIHGLRALPVTFTPRP